MGQPRGRIRVEVGWIDGGGWYDLKEVNTMKGRVSLGGNEKGEADEAEK